MSWAIRRVMARPGRCHRIPAWWSCQPVQGLNGRAMVFRPDADAGVFDFEAQQPVVFTFADLQAAQRDVAAGGGQVRFEVIEQGLLQAHTVAVQAA